MKKHILFVLGLTAIALSVTSCLEIDDDDDDTDTNYQTLTYAQCKAWLEGAEGKYSGKIYIYNPYQDTTDSLDCSWNVSDVNDSTATATVNIPKKIGAMLTTSSTGKLATTDSTTVAQKYTLYPYYNSYTNLYTYYMLPEENDFTYTTDINGADASVKVLYGSYFPFQSTTGYSIYYPISQYVPTTKQYGAYIIIYGVSIDGSDTTAGSIMMINGTKEE